MKLIEKHLIVVSCFMQDEIYDCQAIEFLDLVSCKEFKKLI